MAVSDEQSYQEMMDALSELMTQIGETCDAMSSAAEDCVDNTEEDVNAQKAAELTNKSIEVIKENAETISKVIQYLEEEIEEIRKTREIMDEE